MALSYEPRRDLIRYVFTKFQHFKRLVNVLNTFMQIYEIWFYSNKEMHPVINQYRAFKYGNILRILVFTVITSVGSFRLSTKGQTIENLNIFLLSL